MPTTSSSQSKIWLIFASKSLRLCLILCLSIFFNTKIVAEDVEVDTSYWGETSYGEVVLFLMDSGGSGMGGILYTDSQRDEVVTALGYAYFDGEYYYIEDFEGYSVPFKIIDETSQSATLVFDDGDKVEIYKGFDEDFQEAIELFNSFR